MFMLFNIVAPGRMMQTFFINSQTQEPTAKCHVMILSISFTFYAHKLDFSLSTLPQKRNSSLFREDIKILGKFPIFTL